MSEPSVTIVVVARERFSYAAQSLDSVYQHTKPPFQLVYVDGGSPPPVGRHLAEQSAARGFRLTRVDRYLSPNEARNLGSIDVDSEYIAFLDNDVLVSPGWLQRLVARAETTAASIVAPLYCVAGTRSTRIHNAGGMARFEVRSGKRRFVDSHVHTGLPIDEVWPLLSPRRCDTAEFHGMLVRRSFLERVGRLDEGFRGAVEAHVDLGLLARAEDPSSVWFEPAASVTWVPPVRLAPADLPYFRLRWCEAWAEGGLEHFRVKWGVAPDDPFLTRRRNWMSSRRRLADQHGLPPSSRGPSVPARL